MVSSGMIAAMFDEETGDGLLALLTIEHAALATPIRVVNNWEDITSNGESYTAFPFDIVLPGSEAASATTAQLEIDNVSTEIIAAVRSASGDPPTVTILVVKLSDPDTVEITYPALQMRNVRADAGKVTAELYAADMQTEPYPGGNFTPGSFGGLF